MLNFVKKRKIRVRIMRRKGCIAAALAAIVMVSLCACSKKAADPYEGMVQVESGFGNLIWITPAEGVAVNDLAAEDFAEGKYIGEAYDVKMGIDVSEHQGSIDWAAVASDGIDFAIIRAGYRGYSAGGLFTDAYFDGNIKGARNNGLDVGVYFFSQATNPEEATEEADYLLALLKNYPTDTVTLPIFYDWETIDTDEARTDGVTGEVITECALAFTARIQEAGYEGGVYAYRKLGYFSYDLPRMTHLRWWVATLSDYPDFYYKHDFWQYSITGSVEGIEGDVDRNMLFIPKVTEIQE